MPSQHEDRPACQADTQCVYRATIFSANVDDIGLTAVPLSVEALALQEGGVFDTPLTAAWEVVATNGVVFGLIVEYETVPAAWSDVLVKSNYRRTGPDHKDSPIPAACKWIRIRTGAMPSLARSLDEALRLFALDYGRSQARFESGPKPMNGTS